MAVGQIPHSTERISSVLTAVDNVIDQFPFLAARCLHGLLDASKCSVVICRSNATWSVALSLVN